MKIISQTLKTKNLSFKIIFKKIITQPIFQVKNIIEFIKAWQEYHRKNAILRILCTHCNDNLDEYHPKKRRKLE